MTAPTLAQLASAQSSQDAARWVIGDKLNTGLSASIATALGLTAAVTIGGILQNPGANVFALFGDADHGVVRSGVDEAAAMLVVDVGPSLRYGINIALQVGSGPSVVVYGTCSLEGTVVYFQPDPVGSRPFRRFAAASPECRDETLAQALAQLTAA